MTRSRILTAALATGLLTAAGLLFSTTTAQAANLLTNPGFEAGNLTGWSCSGGTGSVVTSPVHSGSRALAGAGAGVGQRPVHPDRVGAAQHLVHPLGLGARQPLCISASPAGSRPGRAPAAYNQLSLTFTTGACADLGADLPARLVRRRHLQRRRRQPRRPRRHASPPRRPRRRPDPEPAPPPSRPPPPTPRPQPATARHRAAPARPDRLPARQLRQRVRATSGWPTCRRHGTSSTSPSASPPP